MMLVVNSYINYMNIADIMTYHSLVSTGCTDNTTNGSVLFKCPSKSCQFDSDSESACAISGA